MTDESRGDITASDEDIDQRQNRRTERLLLKFGEGVAAEDQHAQAAAGQLLEQVEQRRRLLKRFASREADAFDRGSQAAEFSREGERVGDDSRIRSMSPRIEALGTTERAALKPNDGPAAGAIGPARMLDGVQVELHVAFVA